MVGRIEVGQSYLDFPAKVPLGLLVPVPQQLLPALLGAAVADPESLT